MITINHLQEIYTLDEEFFRQGFSEEYRNLTGKDFDHFANEGEAGILLNTIIDYYLEKDSFLESPLLKGDNPSLRKGLMIVGPTGTGKTSVMRTFSDISRSPKIKLLKFNTANPSESSSILQELQFARRERGSTEIKFATADDVVTEYEKKLRGHNSSFDLISKGRNLFVIDDLLSERLANNFGEKLETMGKILENMEYRTAPFIFTLNPYKDQSINDTLNYIQSRYGARAYDRLFSSLNFIELKGRSLRS